MVGVRAEEKPDLILYVGNSVQLDKHLLLLTQVMDLDLPVVAAFNFIDEFNEQKKHLDIQSLSSNLGVPSCAISSKKNIGIEELKELLLTTYQTQKKPQTSFFELSSIEKGLVDKIAPITPNKSDYARLLILHHGRESKWLDPEIKQSINTTLKEREFTSLRFQINETMQRYDRFLPALKNAQKTPNQKPGISDKIDEFLTHPFIGPLIFIVFLGLLFQSIFSWASYPMDLIDSGTAAISDFVRNLLPAGLFTDFLVDGVIAGIGGVIIFVPQIALLFFILTTLEEVGYMARAVYLFDRIMKKFGLNGRSVVSLTASGACAIPAIMATRTISNSKERLITILVAPLISCSARIPVYALLIALAVPSVTVWGVFNLQGLTFAGIYLFSILSALLAALVFKYILKSNERSYLVMELPAYQIPAWRNVLLTVWIKTKTFVVEAGKIILLISMVLWGLSTFGPGDQMAQAEAQALTTSQVQQLSPTETKDLVANAKLESSYAGHLGHFIEPVIKPLGYDWKIGVALITSFAAREVFVGTVSMLYAIGSSDDEALIVKRLEGAKHSDGSPVYTFATAISLIFFYLFAMQCMSTLAITKKETGSWKWPMIQLGYMTILAYLSAFLAYQLLS